MLNFKQGGMFGRELHKVEGYIQDKRYVRPRLPPGVGSPAPSSSHSSLSSCPPSKKKHCVIYGKWTECLWSVDPQAYEAHKKSEKKGDKKSKNVSLSLLDSVALSCFPLSAQTQPPWLFCVVM